MAKVATKLFREPKEAIEAVSVLKGKGYKEDAIVVITSAERAKTLATDVKPISDMGKLTEMGVPEDTVNYYQYPVEIGGILVVVQGDEGGVAQAQELLRGVVACPSEDRSHGTSPGFLQASRMSATNPLDAQMSGDFRRY
ncbi:MAG: general stress protein [Dehalococcoidia bacterium]|nr:general stress protein [Dehalococcoidia bacterium]